MICRALPLLTRIPKFIAFSRSQDSASQPAGNLARCYPCPAGPPVGQPTWNYVLSHGVGGLRPGDRFHRLSQEIRRCFPNVNVYLMDWSDVASRKTYFGIPAGWGIASKIKCCATQAYGLLHAAGLDPRRTTLIGESFGCYINYEIARQWGGVRRILGFNAATKLAGYLNTALHTVAEKSWTFQTTSVFDAQSQLGDRDLRLRSDPTWNHVDRHTYGLQWLHSRLACGDHSWILCEHDLPVSTSRSFSGTVDVNGHFDPTPLSRLPLPQAYSARRLA